MLGFTIVWIGQAISLLGSNMTGFALTIWAFQLTGKATALALAGFFYTFPLLVASPIAGALVDRSNRKLMMMLSDLASGLVTIGILILYATGRLQIYHIFIGNAISGTFQTFQWPAYSAAITMLVPKQHYARAHAMNDLAGNSTGIFAPLLAGALIPLIKITGILFFDVFSFIVAICALLIVHIPQPKTTEEGAAAKGSLKEESIFGFRYIFKRKPLLGLQLVFLVGNFFSGLGFTLIAPMILSRTSNNSLIFGSVQTAGAIGGVIGGVAMAAWGGTKKKVHGVLAGWAVTSILGQLLTGLGRGVTLWATGMFFSGFFVPLINSSNQAIWQAKVPPDLQGRVFSARRLIAWVVTPVATLIAGPLADYVMEPAMQSGGWLTGPFGWITGIGSGAGMALIIIITAFGAMSVGLIGYLIPTIRNAEELMPDHNAGAAEPEAPAGVATQSEVIDETT